MKTPLYIRAAKVLGRKLETARRGRGLSERECAKQLGIEDGHWAYLENGRLLPRGVELQNRLYGWLDRGETYEQQGKLVTKETDRYSRTSHAQVKAVVRKADAKKLRKLADTYNVNVSDLVSLAVSRFLASTFAHKELHTQVYQVAEAQFLNALKYEPELARLLQFEGIPDPPKREVPQELPAIDVFEKLTEEEIEHDEEEW